jgi:hypothetical protein
MVRSGTEGPYRNRLGRRGGAVRATGGGVAGLRRSGPGDWLGQPHLENHPRCRAPWRAPSPTDRPSHLPATLECLPERILPAHLHSRATPVTMVPRGGVGTVVARVSVAKDLSPLISARLYLPGRALLPSQITIPHSAVPHPAASQPRQMRLPQASGSGCRMRRGVLECG